jgi:TonB family protein
MIAFVLAAALLLDPTTPKKSVAKPSLPAAIAARDVQEPSILSGVAVTLECTARANGHVEGCKVLDETHPGMGFGEAAIALMRDAEVAPGPRDVQFARTILFTP